MSPLRSMDKPKLNLIFDFDSTFVKVEALDELARIALSDRDNKNDILNEIRKITALGMEGVISFPESLSRRFELISADKRNVEELIRFLQENVSDSIKRNKNFFKKNHSNIYIISGGFMEYICPIANEFGINSRNVLANKFIFDKYGNVSGFDKRQVLCQENGKIKQVKKMKLKGDVWIIGDGYTDYQIRKAGLAKKFVVFCENVRRKNILRKGDHSVENMEEFLDLFNISI